MEFKKKVKINFESKFYLQKIRSRLSRVAQYLYYTQNRVIIREGHFANAIYFILDGEITVTRKQWLPVIPKFVFFLLRHKTMVLRFYHSSTSA